MDVHYFMFFMLSSFIRLLFIIPNTLFVMDRKLPHDGVYDDRSKASSAINRCHATMPPPATLISTATVGATVAAEAAAAVW
jgi:hypothetical protein